jgi:hypothetical protein
MAENDNNMILREDIMLTRIARVVSAAFPFFLLFLIPAMSSAYGRAGDDWPEAMERIHLRFWVGDTGPTGPLYSGPQQYPFICWTEQSGLGQPLVDNHDGRGVPVYEVDASGNKTANIIGHSAHCSIATRVDYFYRTTSGSFKPLADPAARPADISRTTLSDGREVDYVVRLERGTINRFIYGIAMLAPGDQVVPAGTARPDTATWNRRLIYAFEGGVGIGHWQGDAKLKYMLVHEGLSQGYAVAFSTGNVTGTHYNLTLAEETALMVKAHFSVTYGRPDYTVGIGGSGGAIQQYIIGQNRPGLLDAAIPQQSYSDMVTQTTYALDCQLLEYYFDVTAAANPRWSVWTNRSLIEGLVASDTFPNSWTKKPGNTECVQSWRTLTPTVLNPAWTNPLYLQALALYQFPPQVIAGIKWTHWNDLQNIYGVDAEGFAPITWDNVGVQYGLQSLVAGRITRDEFLDLNARVGGWKAQRDMVSVNFPWKADASPLTYDPWDWLNINQSPDGGLTPAPRTQGSLAAMNAAYESGQVFTGRIRIPIVDMRWYLEPVLDMHHTQQSFATRARMIKVRGHADNQIIWIGAPPYNPTVEGLALVDEWMANIRRQPWRGVAGNKPAAAVDKCFNQTGATIAAGSDVWNGILDQQAPGACTQVFRPYSTSRIEAGGGITGDIFKCQTVPVSAALARGFYGSVTFTAEELTRLEQIFPTGVCDYSLPDAGLPVRWR